MNLKINQNNFWDTDLEEVEAVFLPEGKKITDLPIKAPDKLTPSQGSVLLHNTVNIDSVVKKPSFIQRVVNSIR